MDFSNYTNDEKYEYLRKVVYEAINHSHTGRLLIHTHHCRNVAKILGGNYDSLTKVQKFLLKADIVSECVNVEGGINRYLRY